MGVFYIVPCHMIWSYELKEKLNKRVAECNELVSLRLLT